MTSKLGLHWLREHPDNQRDLAHIERMQYPSIKPFKPLWDNRDACADVLTVLPRDSYILARDHDLSEQKSDMWADPVGTGTRHANEWADKVRNGQYHFPTDRSFFLGINEPDATNGDRSAIDRYTEAFLMRLRAHGLRGGAFNFSTGHPRTVDGTPNTLADYSVFEASHAAIVRGDHIAVAHIYGTAAVPLAPGHYDRLRACPWPDVEWVIGEFGIDEHVIGGGPHIGYLGPMRDDPAAYCAWLDAAIMGINDPRIHSYQVFTYDFSHPWGSFDVRVIRDALERYDWQHAKTPQPEPAPTIDIYLPAVGNGATQPELRDWTNDENWFAEPKRGIVTADVLNVRTGPGTEFPITKILLEGSAVEADVEAQHGGLTWVRVGDGQWAAQQWITWQGDDSTDNWSRAYPIVLNIEGGLSTDRSDKGNYRPDGTFVGTKFGISALSHPTLDIVNLTREQALEIYHRDYWLASGSDSLTWPLCLLHFDAYVQNQVAAEKFLAASDGDPNLYMAERIDWYTRADTWDSHGKGWMRRCATMLREVAGAA